MSVARVVDGRNLGNAAASCFHWPEGKYSVYAKVLAGAGIAVEAIGADAEAALVAAGVAAGVVAAVVSGVAAEAFEVAAEAVEVAAVAPLLHFWAAVEKEHILSGTEAVVVAFVVQPEALVTDAVQNLYFGRLVDAVSSFAAIAVVVVAEAIAVASDRLHLEVTWYWFPESQSFLCDAAAFLLHSSPVD